MNCTIVSNWINLWKLSREVIRVRAADFVSHISNANPNDDCWHICNLQNCSLRLHLFDQRSTPLGSQIAVVLLIDD